jgi:fluoroacetyl-CoA thioesterase
MKNIFAKGSFKQFEHVVSDGDFARFQGQVVHPVYSTFALARDAEWTTRQFVLDMRDDDEEGIGTFVHVDHKAPAFEHETVLFRGEVEALNDNEIICSVTATVGPRVIALIRTGQKIFKREKISKLFEKR